MSSRSEFTLWALLKSTAAMIAHPALYNTSTEHIQMINYCNFPRNTSLDSGAPELLTLKKTQGWDVSVYQCHAFQRTACGFWFIHLFPFRVCTHMQMFWFTHLHAARPFMTAEYATQLHATQQDCISAVAFHLFLCPSWQKRLNRIHKTKKRLIGKWGVWGGPT